MLEELKQRTVKWLLEYNIHYFTLPRSSHIVLHDVCPDRVEISKRVLQFLPRAAEW